MEYDKIKTAISVSFNIRDCLMKLDWSDCGYRRKIIKEFIKTHDIDTSHFNMQIKKKKYEKIVKNCPICESQFSTRKHPTKEGITCSKSCAATWFRTGEDNPNWKNKSYRNIAFRFHGKKCAVCPESKILDVHHIDENRENNTKDNLIPLCPTHHRYIHSKYKNEVLDKIMEYMATVA